jgi:hypothetical protein
MVGLRPFNPATAALGSVPQPNVNRRGVIPIEVWSKPNMNIAFVWVIGPNFYIIKKAASIFDSILLMPLLR